MHKPDILFIYRYTHTRAENDLGYRQPKISRVYTLDTRSARFGRHSYSKLRAVSQYSLAGCEPNTVLMAKADTLGEAWCPLILSSGRTKISRQVQQCKEIWLLPQFCPLASDQNYCMTTSSWLPCRIRTRHWRRQLFALVLVFLCTEDIFGTRAILYLGRHNCARKRRSAANSEAVRCAPRSL